MKTGVCKEKVVKLGSEEKGFVKCRCNELEERCRKAEARCLVLESEVGKTERKKEALETIIAALKFEKFGVENELRNLKRENEGKDDLNEKKEEENRVLNLMIKVNVLESEKQRAEQEAEEWKKFKVMEMLALQMKDGASMEKVANLEVEGSVQEAGTPYNDTPQKLLTYLRKHKSDGHISRELGSVERVQKKLVFEEDKHLTRKAIPATSSCAIPAKLSIIDVSDNDDEHDFAKIITPCALDRTLVRERKVHSNGKQHGGETMDGYKENIPVSSGSKRRRPAKVVTSDGESDIDDNILISDLLRMRGLEVNPDQATSDLKDCSLISSPIGFDNVKSNNKRRWLRTYEEKGKKGKCTSKGVEDEQSEELGSDNASDSLSGFIVNEGHEFEDDSSNSDSVDFDEILSMFKRNKNTQFKWKLEGEMLAAFGKDDELCMKAVCALYRQQTKSEQVQKATVVHNKRGFCQSDAFRGSTLAEFLTEGDPGSDVKKSVKELKKHDHEGVNVCRNLAIRYSKQLFEIYEKKEDPYFRP